MINALETIQSDPTARIFEIGGLLFAQFNCPQQEAEIEIWTEIDHLLHVLSGKMTWRTTTGIYSAEAGESIFLKKGAYFMPQHLEQHVCVELFFIPDAFVRQTVMELAPDLSPFSETPDSLQPAIRVNNDFALAAFFQAMTIYFEGAEKPPEALLKLKLKELLASILIGQNNPALSAYLRSIALSEAPSIPAIMETNFLHNLPVETFARMCHRSVSSFKRDFRKHYGIPPGKWLLKRRLEHSASLLQTTTMTVTQIAFECGFEDASHFSRAFKEKFSRSPRLYRVATTAGTPPPLPNV